MERDSYSLCSRWVDEERAMSRCGRQGEDWGILVGAAGAKRKPWSKELVLEASWGCNL